MKNIYTALSAMKLVPNCVADVVPINEGAKKFTEILGMGIELTSKEHYNYVIMVCTCDRPKEETWKIIEIKN